MALASQWTYCRLVNGGLGKTELSGKSAYSGEKGMWPRTPVVQRRKKLEFKERRRGPRYAFIASAELIEQKADVRIASRISELSMNGCYLDMMNPFPTGTIVVVKISAGKDFFQATGKIVYSQMNMGAGVSFLEIEKPSQIVLGRWIEEAKNDALKHA